MAIAKHAVERKVRPGRPRLRVIPGGRATSTARRSNRKMSALPTVAAVVVIAACVFGLVVLNVYLAQSSFRLAELQTRVTEAEAEHRAMRLKVAESESPEKVAAAAGALGLVVPEQQEYLEGRPELIRISKAPSRSSDGLKAILGQNP